MGLNDYQYDQVSIAEEDVWISVCAIAAIAAITVSFYLIKKHFDNYTNPAVQKYIIRILFMVPVCALTKTESLLSLSFFLLILLFFFFLADEKANQFAFYSSIRPNFCDYYDRFERDVLVSILDIYLSRNNNTHYLNDRTVIVDQSSSHCD
eukprot:TRINITY_DN7416_c0_g1_i1.p1 TRINITY_DN7416_c0_g1~~TRINITY_DN7416_c0_g1_i1.p1  ORF type:complete len:151 (+),score=13.67 TRINITY_DN7416_c0_g1_i1:59-511(+)